jgi:hypothetical protein
VRLRRRRPDGVCVAALNTAAAYHAARRRNTRLEHAVPGLARASRERAHCLPCSAGSWTCRARHATCARKTAPEPHAVCSPRQQAFSHYCTRSQARPRYSRSGHAALHPEPEHALWWELRGSRLGVLFRRQVGRLPSVGAFLFADSNRSALSVLSKKHTWASVKFDCLPSSKINGAKVTILWLPFTSHTNSNDAPCGPVTRCSHDTAQTQASNFNQIWDWSKTRT